MIEVAAEQAPWLGDWFWALPLIVVTVVFHVLGLGLLNRGVIAVVDHPRLRRAKLPLFVWSMGTVAVIATILHGIEASIWGLAYLQLGALPDPRGAMLFSLNAITSFGHADLQLASHWQALGALEALNGIMLFGLTTAFLFATMQRVWPLDGRSRH